MSTRPLLLPDQAGSSRGLEDFRLGFLLGSLGKLGHCRGWDRSLFLTAVVARSWYSDTNGADLSGTCW